MAIFGKKKKQAAAEQAAAQAAQDPELILGLSLIHISEPTRP